jgi:hypothetical protein
MVSSEFSKIYNKSDVSASPFTLNYSSMDKLHMSDKNHERSLDEPKDTSLRSSFSHSLVKDLQQSGHSVNEASMINETIETLNNQSSIERINQLVMQSVERVKRTALNYNTDDFLNSLNCMKNMGKFK